MRRAGHQSRHSCHGILRVVPPADGKWMISTSPCMNVVHTVAAWRLEQRPRPPSAELLEHLAWRGSCDTEHRTRMGREEYRKSKHARGYARHGAVGGPILGSGEAQMSGARETTNANQVRRKHPVNHAWATLYIQLFSNLACNACGSTLRRSNYVDFPEPNRRSHAHKRMKRPRASHVPPATRARD